jgi:hypothetical protein
VSDNQPGSNDQPHSEAGLASKSDAVPPSTGNHVTSNQHLWITVDGAAELLVDQPGADDEGELFWPAVDG